MADEISKKMHLSFSYQSATYTGEFRHAQDVLKSLDNKFQTAGFFGIVRMFPKKFQNLFGFLMLIHEC
jgi:hypothetical protein